MAPYPVVAFGDSLTYGYPFGNPLSWVQRVSDELNVPILNQGANGDSLAHLLRRVNFDVLDLHPKICIILGGTNDIFQGTDLNTMKANFTKLTEKLLDHKVLPVIGLPPPIKDAKLEKTMTTYRNWLKRHAKACSLKVIDFHKPFLDKQKRIRSVNLEDGVHPSSKGYELMAQTALPILQKILEN